MVCCVLSPGSLSLDYAKVDVDSCRDPMGQEFWSDLRQAKKEIHPHPRHLLNPGYFVAPYVEKSRKSELLGLVGDSTRSSLLTSTITTTATATLSTNNNRWGRPTSSLPSASSASF